MNSAPAWGKRAGIRGTPFLGGRPGTAQPLCPSRCPLRPDGLSPAAASPVPNTWQQSPRGASEALVLPSRGCRWLTDTRLPTVFPLPFQGQSPASLERSGVCRSDVCPPSPEVGLHDRHKQGACRRDTDGVSTLL